MPNAPQTACEICKAGRAGKNGRCEECASTQTPNSAKTACVDLPIMEDKPVWKEEWFWGAMSFVGAMALGLFSFAFKKNTETKDGAREDPEAQITPERSVVITKASNARLKKCVV